MVGIGPQLSQGPSELVCAIEQLPERLFRCMSPGHAPTLQLVLLLLPLLFQAGLLQEFIAVLVWNTPQRLQEYMPAGEDR